MMKGIIETCVCMQTGLDAHLSKPAEPDLLFETLENLI